MDGISIIKKDTLQAIADSIRYVEDSSDPISVSDYAERITATKIATYGVRFYGSAVNGTRLYDAVGKNAGINGAVNDFDELPIFKDIQPVYLNAKDSSGRDLLDSKGQPIVNKMIRIPNFWVKHIEGNDGSSDFDEWRITSDGKGREGYHAMFVDRSGKVLEYALVGAYFTTYLDNQSLLGCQKGQNPRVNIGQHNVDSSMCYVDLNGLRKLHGCEDATIWSAIAILSMIEFATRNCQSIMQGINGDEYRRICVNAGEADLNPKNASVNELHITSGAGCISGKKVGDTIQIYNGRWNTRRITALDTTKHSGYTSVGLDSAITLGSDPYVSYAWAEEVGSTDSLAGSSARIDSGAKSHFKYRGIEDCWGNLWHICSGYYYKGDGTDEYLMRNATPESASASGSRIENTIVAKSDGFAKRLGITEDDMGVVLFTKEVGGAANTYYCDYFYQSVASSNYAYLCGGYAVTGGLAGAFFLIGVYGFVLANWNYGCRPSLFA